MTQEIERLGCPFCGAQPQEYSGDSDFLECSNEDCDLHGVEIQEDYWQARARVGKGEVERRKAIAGLHGCRLAARGEYCASCVIQATNYEYQGEEDRRSKPHDYALSAKPVEVGELVEYLCCNTNLFSNDIEEAAQAILTKYNVTEKL